MKLSAFLTLPIGCLAVSAAEPIALNGADSAKATVSMTEEALLIEYSAPGIGEAKHAIYVALDADPMDGSFILPYGQNVEGAAAFLPFAADVFAIAEVRSSGVVQHLRTWEKTMWSERKTGAVSFTAEIREGRCSFKFPRSTFAIGKTVRFTVYAKNLGVEGGWGRMFGSLDETVAAGPSDKPIPFGIVYDPSHSPAIQLQPRFLTSERVRIYQLFVRLFGNTNETRKPNGTLAENGTGKFSDINDAALRSLRAMNFSHLWLTGVLQQATATDYSSAGQPADDPDLLKGLAGSPYAIKDYYDVSPDYAEDPAKRLEEFKALIGRIHSHDLKAIIDFVPNHVARSYASDIKPDNDFGADDDRTTFFASNNNFFYLSGKDRSTYPPARTAWRSARHAKYSKGNAMDFSIPRRSGGGLQVITLVPGPPVWATGTKR